MGILFRARPKLKGRGQVSGEAEEGIEGADAEALVAS